VPHADGDAGLVAMMQGVADAFTAGLRAHPQDWHMMQRVFVEDLDPGR
jgi:KDO2-lipid IV(A) lauroyltransferase